MVSRKKAVKDMAFDAKKLIMLGAEQLDADKFDYDRKLWLNASEAGTCIRKQWFERNQPEDGDEDSWGYARRGIHAEKYIVSALLAANVPLRNAAAEQLTVQDEERRLSGTPDGVIIYDDEWVVPEFKSIDPRVNKKNLPKPEHVLQLEINMELLAKSTSVIMRGVLIYMDASDFDDIIQFDVARRPAVLDEQAKRAKKLLGTRKVSMLDREGKARGGKECNTMCRFKKVCGVTDVDPSSRVRANRGSAFSTAAVEYLNINEIEDQHKIRKAELKEVIIGELALRRANKADVGGIRVSLDNRAGRTTLDKKAVSQAGIDLSPYQKTGAPSQALTVSRKP